MDFWCFFIAKRREIDIPTGRMFYSGRKRRAEVNPRKLKTESGG